MARVSRVLPHLSVAEVQEKIRATKNFRTQQKWLIVYNALVDPRPAAEIALHTGTTIRTVHQVISDYNRLGANAIETMGKGGRRKSYLSLDEEKAFLTKLETPAKIGEITTKAEVKQAFEQQVGHQVHKSTVYRLLRRHQWRKIKPRPRHPKADTDKQAEFTASFKELVAQICQLRVPSDQRPVLLMASDQGRFGRTGSVHPCWCPSGFRPTVVRQQVRQYIYAYAAVAPAIGRMSCLVLPYAHTTMMNLFLKQVSQEFAAYLIILQVDRASWHRAKNLRIPENIRLLPQPPYSPEVMPVEHVWDDIREQHFDNHIFNSLDAVENTLCKALKTLDEDPARLRSMTFFPHLRIPV